MTHMIIILVISLFPVLCFASKVPSAHPLDHRIRDVRYTDGQVYRVYTSVLQTTAIEFPPGETLDLVVTGDTEALKFDNTPGGRIVSFKPTQSGLQTNIILYTNRRAYYLEVIENPKKGYFSVRFNGGYTVKEGISFDSKQVIFAGRHILYGANVKNAITPTEVWDDGVYTYFKFYKTSPVPAIFKTQTGEESTVNSAVVEEGIVRVTSISQYWILRYGDLETVICRYPAKKHLIDSTQRRPS